MYERFTDRARKVMQLANVEAQRFNHEYVDTEHVLLGLVKEGSGMAANVLKNLDIDLQKVHLEVEKIVQPGPDMVTMGKLPQTPRAKKVIELSIAEAQKRNHSWIGTEHVLLGLVKEREGIAALVLKTFGVDEGKVLPFFEKVWENVGKDQNESSAFLSGGFSKHVPTVLGDEVRKAGSFQCTVPPVENGWIRVSLSVQISPDGRTANWTVVDRELLSPAEAVKARSAEEKGGKVFRSAMEKAKEIYRRLGSGSACRKASDPDCQCFFCQCDRAEAGPDA